MNRIKVWLYAVAVAAAAYLTLRAYTQQLRAGAMTDLDARLASASAQALAATRSVAREASAAAALASRDTKLVEALHAKEAKAPAPPPRKGKKARPPPPPAVDPDAQETALREAARAALAAAERVLGFDLPDASVVTAGNREWLARKGKGRDAEGEAMAFLRGAIGGRAQRGYVRLNGALFYAAASPAGEGAGLVVLAPIDEAWVRGLAGAADTLVTLSVPEVKVLSTAGPDAQSFSGWARGAGVPTDVGQLGKTPLALGPVKLPMMPLPFGSAPLFRARAVQLEGLKGGFVVAAVPTAQALGAVSQLHWQITLGIALVLGVGLVLGLFVHASEAPAALPEELVSAAASIERGDFSARVPPLAGKFGTIATALNRAAELAGPAAAVETARASVTDEFFRHPPAAQAEPPEPPAQEPEPEPAPAPAAEAPRPAVRAAPSAPVEMDEEAHFQQVFSDFLRTRATCGEPSEGLTYDKFRLKLDGNKAALVSKYGCKTVRFQVYVKDGKAALKATPVK